MWLFIDLPENSGADFHSFRYFPAAIVVTLFNTQYTDDRLNDPVSVKIHKIYKYTYTYTYTHDLLAIWLYEAY